MEKLLFTSESVTEGHPDKMCDAISDAILDALMEKDPMSRVACETCTTTGLVMVMGEITTNAYVDIQKIVRETVREIGYDRAKYGFDCDTCGVIVALDEQSKDIALGVDTALEKKENTMDDDALDAIGAGDQGIACQGGIACFSCKSPWVVDGFIFIKHPVVVGHIAALRAAFCGSKLIAAGIVDLQECRIFDRFPGDRDPFQAGRSKL